MQEQQQQVQQAQAEAAAARSTAEDAGKAATQAQHQLHQLHDAHRSVSVVHLQPRTVCDLPLEVWVVCTCPPGMHIPLPLTSQ